ncbi:GNAT family N-acetyltransferase [Oceanirhabdus sp. W0125-5]|uniref:GNAT family N-acetyltransferase n=1 Tax=Oceanirhabdus sp. W0125-5 TaxID=2999116 RepID=UPI0022F2C2D0|nr:GNAT family N-acetyltransferase [Oceanirhabdus sp. W0125-5]WBW95633.1 GNAT family N-acetyltransferase [Oceanirhabdus sp. W0125-5]
MDRGYYFDCIDTAITLYWRALGSARNMQLYTGDFEYVKSVDGKGPERIFNINISSEKIAKQLDDIVNKIRGKEIPDSFLITPNTKPANLVDLLVQRGFEVDTSGLCMAMDLCDLKSNKMSSDKIEVREVKDDKSLKEWVHIINTALFQSEIMSFEQFYDIYNLDNTRFYLGLFEGVPVSACFTIYDGIFGDLDMVATLKNYRNKGLASLTIDRALRDLDDLGVKTVSLRAETGGIELYKKIGFKEYCKRVSVSY